MPNKLMDINTFEKSIELTSAAKLAMSIGKNTLEKNYIKRFSLQSN